MRWQKTRRTARHFFWCTVIFAGAGAKRRADDNEVQPVSLLDLEAPVEQLLAQLLRGPRGVNVEKLVECLEPFGVGAGATRSGRVFPGDQQARQDATQRRPRNAKKRLKVSLREGVAAAPDEP